MNFSDFWGIGWAVKLLVISASVASFLAMAAILNGLIGGIVAVWPEWAQSGAYMLPYNAGACVSAFMTATIARFVYDWQLSHLRLAAR